MSSHQGADNAIQRLNLSFVLHEASNSPSIVAAAARNAPVWTPNPAIAGVDLNDFRADTVLTAHIGMPSVLSASIAGLPAAPAVVAVDRATDDVIEFPFFRAAALLNLPTWSSERTVVAAVVVRPGATSGELVASPPRRWPEEQTASMRDLEDLIRTHVDQWRAPRALWRAAAEVLLPEVNEQLPLTGTNTG